MENKVEKAINEIMDMMNALKTSIKDANSFKKNIMDEPNTWNAIINLLDIDTIKNIGMKEFHIDKDGYIIKLEFITCDNSKYFCNIDINGLYTMSDREIINNINKVSKETPNSYSCKLFQYNKIQ